MRMFWRLRFAEHRYRSCCWSSTCRNHSDVLFLLKIFETLKCVHVQRSNRWPRDRGGSAGTTTMQHYLSCLAVFLLIPPYKPGSSSSVRLPGLSTTLRDVLLAPASRPWSRWSPWHAAADYSGLWGTPRGSPRAAKPLTAIYFHDYWTTFTTADCISNLFLMFMSIIITTFLQLTLFWIVIWKSTIYRSKAKTETIK